MVYTLDNSASAVDATNVNFTDNLPDEIRGPDTVSVFTHNCSSGILSFNRGALDRLEFFQGSIVAGNSCTVRISVTSSTGGNHVSTSEDMTSSLGNSGSATATLTVAGPEINIRGNGRNIASDSNHTPNRADGTGFGSAQLAGGTVVRTFTIRNTGAADLVLGANAVSIAGANATDFTVTQQPAATVTTGNSTTFDITFDPSAPGTRGPADVTIANNDADESPYNFRIRGTGVEQADLSIQLADAPDPVMPGANITYSGTVANAGPAAANGSVVTFTLPAGTTFVSSAGCAEDPAGVPTCSLGTINSGAQAQFTVTANVDAGTTGQVTANASVTSGVTDPDGANNTAQATTTIDGTPPSVTIAAPADARGPFTATVTFSEPVTGFDLGDVVLTGGAASNFDASAAPVFTFTVTPNAGTALSTVTIDVPANVAVDGANNGNTAALQVSVNIIAEDAVRTRTSAIINNYLANRADQITASDPNLAGRLGGAIPGDMTAGFAPFGIGIGANITNGQSNYALATSLKQIRKSLNAADARKRKTIDGELGVEISAFDAERTDNTGWDMWMQAALLHIDTDTSETNLGLVFAGVDYQFSDRLLVGLMGQYDWADENGETAPFSIDGNGWLVGPYLVAKPTEATTFQARIAYGGSENEISPFNTYTDTFKTDRFLAKAQLEGQMEFGTLNVSPHLGVLYFNEKQKSYTDSLGIVIPSQSVDLGRLTFGPTVSTRIEMDSGATIVPSLTFPGIWDFESPERRDIDTGLVSSTSNELRARLQGGVSLEMENGWNINAGGFYDGIGASDLKAFGGTLKLSVPLN